MVKKKNDELRFCCDFRLLNEVTVKDAYPLPRIDGSLARLGKAKIYTSIGLAWFENAPNLTAEVSNEFMKASQITQVTSTASHPRTQGLVERQNRT